MNQITVDVELLEVDDQTTRLKVGKSNTRITVESHPLHEDRFILDIGGHKYDLSASSLRKAIVSATNR